MTEIRGGNSSFQARRSVVDKPYVSATAPGPRLCACGNKSWGPIPAGIFRCATCKCASNVIDNQRAMQLKELSAAKKRIERG
jgi:ribosomal protein L34E